MTANVMALSKCRNTSLQQIATVFSSVNSNHKNDKFSSVKATNTNLHSKVLNSQQNMCRSKSWGGGQDGFNDSLYLELLYTK
jgi:hypothetical protein